MSELSKGHVVSGDGEDFRCWCFGKGGSGKYDDSKQSLSATE